MASVVNLLSLQDVDLPADVDLMLRRQAEASKVLEKMQENPSRVYTFSRIRKIDGVKCSVELVHSNYRAYFRVNSNVIFDGHDPVCLYESKIKKNCTLNYETIHELIDEMYTTLPLLKYNKQIGRFEMEPTFETADLVYMGLEICCVCREETTTTTKCGHTLCIICWQTLKKNKCPICQRRGLLFCDGDGSFNDDSDEE